MTTSNEVPHRLKIADDFMAKSVENTAFQTRLVAGSIPSKITARTIV